MLPMYTPTASTPATAAIAAIGLRAMKRVVR
jgi:hypothetical protein